MAFRPINTALAQESQMRAGEEANPSTPRPSTAPQMPSNAPRDDATTPTRANFGSLASQRPLPTKPFPADIAVPSSASSDKHSCLHRGDSQHSTKSRDSEDVDMDDSEDGEDGSDEESVNADGTRSSRKKKSQRFYCTDYPPCNLSFTRSEHLARHIRKHTGERPFQCHCSRRFSRLDNLRQHAQTVHQNEDIPQDSLAATGTRFQRQVRTERIRPPGNRSRANSTQSGPIRGHQRNSLSTSSITSVASGYSQASDLRRRPPPLVMAGRDPQARYSQEIYRPESPSSQYGYRPQSPGAFGTPTSATFSTGQNSPRWGSTMQSPIMSHSRTASLHGNRTPGRRLSVPSSGNPFQSPHGGSYGPPVLSQLNASNAGAFTPSSNMVSSPTSSTAGSVWSRRESVTSASDEAWRRRTWHPETYNNFTSRLQQVTTPNYYSNGPLPQPPIVPSNAPPLQPANSMRLPGIESFDPLPPRTSSPVRREPSPMMVDTPTRAPPQREPYSSERPGSQHWDMGINRNLNRLDIGRGTNDNASSWASEVNHAVQARAEETRAQPAIRFEESPYSARVQQGERSFHQHTISAPPITPRSAKRQGWYAGPMTSPPGHSTQQPLYRTSPVDSSSSDGGPPATPQSSMAESHPAILRSNGWVDQRNNAGMVPTQQPSQGSFISYPQPPAAPEYRYPARSQHEQASLQPESNNMLRLEALVAVATAKSSEENGAIHA